MRENLVISSGLLMSSDRNILRHSSYFLCLTPTSLFLLRFWLLPVGVGVSPLFKGPIMQVAKVIGDRLNIFPDIKIFVDF